MELSWLENILYGLISGLTEFLPISALAHQTVFLTLLGKQQNEILQLSAHIGALIALVMACFPTLRRLNREWRIYTMPKSRRRRHPDFGILMEMRVFRTGAAVVLLSFLAYNFVSDLYQRLWVLAILIGINGILVYIPPYLPSANKGAQSMSRLDNVLIGIAAGCGIVPGISAVGSSISVARIRGVDRQYAMELSLLLAIPALIVMCILELMGSFAIKVAMSGILALKCGVIMISAFVGSFLSIRLVRFMAVKAGFSGFAYYCWGLALFTLILYLI